MTKKHANTRKIVLQADEVVELVDAYRKLGKTIVLTQGSFDMVHIGHGRYFQQAKSYGDILVVGVDSDAKIRKRKGEDRPVVPQEERLEMLTYLESVDIVVLKELEAPKYNLIKLVKPDVLVATAETYTDKQISTLKKWAKAVEVLKPMATTSTSAKIRRLQIGMSKKLAEHLIDKLRSKLPQVMEDILHELRDDK